MSQPPVARPHSARAMLLVLIAVAMLLTGCRAMAAAVVLGVAAGFVIASARYDPPPRHAHYHGWYWYHDTWHREPPHPVRVELYYHNGCWYRSSRYHEAPSYHGYTHSHGRHGPHSHDGYQDHRH